MAIDFNTLKETYRTTMDELQDGLSKSVLLVYPGKVTNNSNNGVDLVTGKSKLPAHKTNAPTITTQQEVIQAIVRWKPKNIERYGININTTASELSEQKTIIKLRTYLTQVPKLKRASYIIPNYGAKNIIEKKFRLIKFFYPQGLDMNRYAISFWEAI